MTRELWKGNEAIAEAAIRAGLEGYFGYPITPQTETLEWMSRRMPELGRIFLQAESEPAAINMVYGAACTGARVMTSSSSPGISLMMEGLSYIAGTEVPVVLVDVMRGGPGLGNIAPSQGDYNQICHGGGHGDYHPIVLAPASVQEAVDLVPLAFDLAEKYLNIACVLLDGSIGQMMEPVELPEMRPVVRKEYAWATTGAKDRSRHVLTSIYLEVGLEEEVNLRLLKRWEAIKANEVRFKEYYLDDAEIAVIGFGTAGRVALSAVRAARAQGIKVGLFRPISVSPYPYQQVAALAERVKSLLVVEMNTGQMLEDVRLAVSRRIPIEFYGRLGGVVPFPDEILGEIQRIAKQPPSLEGHPAQRWLERMTAPQR
ncbi:3-methyl-2-oxobutanoate dehydrogenase subunit VorB [bacterium]|nr:3-methyl-2-oxobutanoate dehydrogenase subunit VorB [bacterium]OIO84401.1 MAG: 3-methyl-2-oxobutanoate dehydrogenase subunit VorB [Anaerolineae bacterium CG2_30_58_95]PIZ25464.1 MAG: 3-methyl-2-oxobutanoate dehydrogenase subunit VorB [Chloroflexi bacterium CG_4_10_14_0_8_um_filter_57_5]PJH74671.1 MAG: 3-methyl-2-oxobutanoate dehydrogenase subunit VorB [Anaerolineae bacterium CG_4_9_14_0_8_um_filter_58_9]